MKRSLLMLTMSVILGMASWSCEPTSDFDEVVVENNLKDNMTLLNKDKENEEGTPSPR